MSATAQLEAPRSRAAGSGPAAPEAEPTETAGVKPGKSAAELTQSLLQSFTAPIVPAGQEPSPTEANPPAEAPPATEGDPEISTPDPGATPAAPPGEEAEQSEQNLAEWPESARKRVDKLTHQKATLKQQAEEAKAKAEAAAARVLEIETELGQLREQQAISPVQPTPENPLAHVHNEAELTRTAHGAKQILRDIERFERGALRGEDKTKFENWLKKVDLWNEAEAAPDTSAVADLKFRMEDLLNEHVPARLNYLTAERSLTAKAAEVYPWLKDKTSADYQGVQNVLRRFPAIKQLPQWQFVAVNQWLGEKQTLALLQKKGQSSNGSPATITATNGTPRKPVTPAPRVVVPGPAPRMAADSKAQMEALRDKANSREATEADVVAYTQALLTAR